MGMASPVAMAGKFAFKGVAAEQMAGEANNSSAAHSFHVSVGRTGSATSLAKPAMVNIFYKEKRVVHAFG
jgi:hypothetical protein